jgi:hypothetical protein
VPGGSIGRGAFREQEATAADQVPQFAVDFRFEFDEVAKVEEILRIGRFDGVLRNSSDVQCPVHHRPLSFSLPDSILMQGTVDIERKRSRDSGLCVGLV